ncbi:hypothetical protein [Sphingomonas sp.]|uniref:hypothetical protein n=1 Tax=Sphingomonas sp. TaxID=28214 RepID=UPI0025DFA76C|nr:hypothetical protein [Sphingomonas sp.]
MSAGYSGTPLAKKLGLKPGIRVWFDNAMPESVRAEIDPAAIGVVELAEPAAGLEAAHMFVTLEWELRSAIGVLRPLLAPSGFVWIAWPQKGIQGAERNHRRPDPRGRAADGPRRYQGVRDRHGLVGSQADDPPERTLTDQPY